MGKQVSFQEVVGLVIAIETAEAETQEIEATMHKTKTRQDRWKQQRKKEECGKYALKHYPSNY